MKAWRAIIVECKPIDVWPGGCNLARHDDCAEPRERIQVALRYNTMTSMDIDQTAAGAEDDWEEDVRDSSVRGLAVGCAAFFGIICRCP